MNWDKFIKTKETTSNAGEKMQPNYVRVLNEDGSKGLKVDGKYNIQEQIDGHIEECMFNADKAAINGESMLPNDNQFNKSYKATEGIIERQTQHETNNILRQRDLDYIVNQIKQQTEQKDKVKEVKENKQDV